MLLVSSISSQPVGTPVIQIIEMALVGTMTTELEAKLQAYVTWLLALVYRQAAP